jgi:inosose dehydratase
METRLKKTSVIIQSLVITGLFISQLTCLAQSKSKIKIGSCAITWGNDYFAAIRESADLGYAGIQLRGNVYKAHQNNPDSLIKVLNQANISMPIMSGSGLGSGKKSIEEEIEQLRLEATFVKKIGGEFLQVVGPKRDPENPPSDSLLIAFAKLMNQAGEIVAKEGIRLVFHNHMHDYGQTPEEIDVIAVNIDAKKVGLLLDVAHCYQGGGNPTEVFKKWQNNISIFHLKDVRPSSKKPEPYDYIFTELGEGKVELLPFFDALKKSGFSGWTMVELDGVPEPGRTPKECAEISKKFLEERVGLKMK